MPQVCLQLGQMIHIVEHLALQPKHNINHANNLNKTSEIRVLLFVLFFEAIVVSNAPNKYELSPQNRVLEHVLRLQEDVLPHEIQMDYQPPLFPIPCMSDIFSVGFVGLSNHISLVLGVIAASTFANSEVST